MKLPLAASQTVPPYEAISHVYDGWGIPFNYSRAAAFIKEYVPQGNSIHCLDVCCGTATLGCHLGEQGFHVLGVDRSTPMLKVGKTKIQKARLDGRVVLQKCDIATEDWPGRNYDVIVSTADSLNYFSLPEMQQILKRAFAVLRRGGVLVFDLNSKRKLCDIFGNTRYSEKFDDFCYVWQNSHCEPERKVTFDIDLFVRKGTSYQRFREIHMQYYLESEEVTSLLSRAGFHTLAMRDDYTVGEAGPDTMRAVYVATKC